MTGTGTAKKVLRGKINRLKTLQGLSAYEIAVLNGFNGTERDWLESLGSIEGFAETWTFKMEDGNTITKEVYVK